MFMESASTRREAVRLARERLGEAPPQELAAFVEATFGLKLQPAVVSVLLASFREREALEQSRAKAMEAIERARAEQPEGRPAGKKPRKKAAPKQDAMEHPD